MRPQILYPLFADVTALTGVGEKLAVLLEKLTGGRRVLDLLLHLPTHYIDRRPSPDILKIPDGMTATLTVTVTEHAPSRNTKRAGRGNLAPYRVYAENDSGFLTLTFFHARPDYLTRILPVGAQRVISGRVERYHGQVHMPHPDYILPPEQRDRIPALEAVYPLMAGVSNRQLMAFIQRALGMCPELPEWLDDALLRREAWPAWRAALRLIHQPGGDTPPVSVDKARERLAYDEILAEQLALRLLRQRQYNRKAPMIPSGTCLRERLRALLPYKLTGGQESVLQDIDQDMASGERMLRLVQGDVGCGKTVVALMAMLSAVEAGQQAALMAPTGILARQHWKWIGSIAEQMRLRGALLTGHEKGETRRQLLDELAGGRLSLLVGTHALIQEPVTFHSLALAVIDEQHRFGVSERLKLAAKGNHAHTLLMTATPIPRSLTMALYGDMDCSRLTEKPANRQPIDTRVMPVDKAPQVMERLRHAIATGAKIYWVCPLVEESELVDLAAVEERHAILQQHFGDRVGIVHGRMDAAARDRVMAAFTGNELDILVATTVIEVGVDVPTATIMVIEHADRFGLSQLHQLRGRVGRGDKPSSCLLLYGENLSESGIRRLSVMRETNDGFRIAEEDLKLRGGGDILGTRQSGLPAFRLADFATHRHLFTLAHDDARLTLYRDPQLHAPRGAALRSLLYLFSHDAQAAYVKAG